MNASSESLPPPPAYLLDSTGRTSPGKVGETIKALTELNHMPASPSVLRRNMSPASPQVNAHSHHNVNHLPCIKSLIAKSRFMLFFQIPI